MRLRTMAVLAAFVACLAAGSRVHAHTTVTVLETFPAGDKVTLGSNQNFYVRLAYATDTPVRIWAKPYFHGKPANVGSNPSDIHTGSGETFGWFFFMRPGDRVDEIRIAAGNGGIGTTPVVTSLRVDVVGSDTVATDRAEPAWVTDMKRRAEDAQRKDYEKRMNTPPAAGDVVLFGGFMLLMLLAGLGAIALPGWALWRWRGGWRIAAAVPALLMTFVVLRIVADGARDPTSHNLWPFEILQAGVLSLVAMVALMVARKLAGVGRQ